MLGFFPLGAYELESPADLTEFKQNAYILGAVTLAGLALSGWKPLSTAAELAAGASASFSAATVALHTDAALYASPTALSMLADAALHRAPTMRAAAAADTAAQALRLNLAHLHLVASASTSLDAGAVYTIHLPRALSAASSGSSDVAPIYAVPLPRALFAAAEATISASANITPTVNFAASGVVDLALGQAKLRRSVLFDAAAQVEVAGDGYLTRAANMHSSAGSLDISGSVQKIDLEHWLAAAAAVSTVSVGTLGVSAMLWASASSELSASSVTDTPKTQEFPQAVAGFSTYFVEGVHAVGTYGVRYDTAVLRMAQFVDDADVGYVSTAVFSRNDIDVAAVGAVRLALVSSSREEQILTTPLEETVVDD